MKKIFKITVLAIGLASIGFMLNSVRDLDKSKDMEAAKGSTPSSSYQYHLQIFHAF